MRLILEIKDVAKAIYVDEDYDKERLQQYAETATSFIKTKTGYDFAQEEEIEPLAKQCAILYVRQMHFGAEGYNKDHDYSFGITSLLIDLQSIAKERMKV